MENNISIIPQQLALFTRESLRAKTALLFDPLAIQGQLKKREGKRVWAVDMGGDLCRAQQFVIQKAKLQRIGRPLHLNSSHGAGYLQFLKKIGAKAAQAAIPFAISSAGEIKNNRYMRSSNISLFIEELDKEAGGNLHRVLPTFQLLINDAVAGSIVATMKGFQQYAGVQEVIYIINGTGIGGAVYKEGNIIACEPGDLPIAPLLNKFHQQSERIFGSSHYTTLEQVGASKAGIEDMYYQKTHRQLDGKGISNLWQTGDSFAKQLYEHSALITAHVVLGLANVFGLLTKQRQTVVVFHGGIFNVPEYRALVEAILHKYLGFSVLTLQMTRENPGLEGAALATLVEIC